MTSNDQELTLEQFMAYKEANYKVLPELESFIGNSDHKRHRSRQHNWRKMDQRFKTNWIVNKKFNQNEDEKLFSQFRSILNKMSDSNLDDLSEELINLEIKKKDQLEKLVEFIFMKAISEPKFSVMYAKLSKGLASYYIEEEGTKIYFRALLINRCQNMFNEGIALEKTLETESNETFKFKEHILGCMVYIGELYNHELLTDKIIHSCFMLIFMKGPRRAYIVDILCTLMKTVGARFFKRCPHEADGCIKKMEQLKNGEGISIKEKFAIMDIFDLKEKEKW